MKKNLFTMVEIMAVMTIIVIVLSIGVSGYRNISSQSSLIMESNEVITKLKKSHDYSIRSRTPTIYTVLMGATFSEKSYLMGGMDSLTYAFNFDTTDSNGEWAPYKGFNKHELDLGGGTDEDFRDQCINGQYGMCMDLRTTNDFLTIKNNKRLSDALYGIYMECKILLQPGAQSGTGTIFNAGALDLQVDSNGYLFISGSSLRVPDASEPHLNVVVDTGKWIRIGYSLTTHMERVYTHLFVDGKVVDSYPKGLSATFPDTGGADWLYSDMFGEVDGSDLEFGNGFDGMIDDIKIYDGAQGEIFPVDPKAGFLVTAHGKHLAQTTNEANKSITSILVDGDGRFVPLNDTNPQNNNWEADMIGFASSSIYGQLDSGFNWGHRVWEVTGSKITGLPEAGHLLLYHKNNHVSSEHFYEIVEYHGFDGQHFIRKRPLVGTDSKTGTRTNFNARYVVPFIVSQ